MKSKILYVINRSKSVFSLVGFVFVACVASGQSPTSDAAGFRALQVFSGEAGNLPLSSLTLYESILFGTTSAGGKHDAGVLFSFLPEAGEFRVLHHFTGDDGRDPKEGLIVGERAVYGATRAGGEDQRGTIYRYDRATSAVEVIHPFGDGPENGFHPHASPVLVGEALIGTTFHGGETLWGGAIYAFDLRTMQFRVLYSMTADSGRHPVGRLLPLGGWLYGVASDYGLHGAGYYGTLFRVRPDGSALEVLHRFEGGEQGSTPFGGLSHDDGNILFGSAFGNIGDPSDLGVLFAYNLETGEFRVLHSFREDAVESGGKPDGAPVYDPRRGLLFGVSHGTDNVAPGRPGALYTIRPDGADYAVMHRFSGGIAGGTPVGAPVLFENVLYGVAAHGGLEPLGRSEAATGRGLLYSFDLGPPDNFSVGRFRPASPQLPGEGAD